MKGNRNTVKIFGIWESVFNPGSNYGEFAAIRSQAERKEHANGKRP